MGWRELLWEMQGSAPPAQLEGETDKPLVWLLLREQLSTREGFCKKELNDISEARE